MRSGTVGQNIESDDGMHSSEHAHRAGFDDVLDEVDNLKINKEYSVNRTENIFCISFSDPRKEISRIAK